MLSCAGPLDFPAALSAVIPSFIPLGFTVSQEIIGCEMPRGAAKPGPRIADQPIPGWCFRAQPRACLPLDHFSPPGFFSCSYHILWKETSRASSPRRSHFRRTCHSFFLSRILCTCQLWHGGRAEKQADYSAWIFSLEVILPSKTQWW